MNVGSRIPLGRIVESIGQLVSSVWSPVKGSRMGSRIPLVGRTVSVESIGPVVAPPLLLDPSVTLI